MGILYHPPAGGPAREQEEIRCDASGHSHFHFRHSHGAASLT